MFQLSGFSSKLSPAGLPLIRLLGSSKLCSKDMWGPLLSHVVYAWRLLCSSFLGSM